MLRIARQVADNQTVVAGRGVGTLSPVKLDASHIAEMLEEQIPEYGADKQKHAKNDFLQHI